MITFIVVQTTPSYDLLLLMIYLFEKYIRISRRDFCTTWAYVKKVAISYQQMATFPIDGVRIVGYLPIDGVGFLIFKIIEEELTIIL